MTPEEIPSLRLYHSGLSHSPFTTAAEAVAHSGAVQAQDFSAAIWSLGLRIRDATAATIEDAYNDGRFSESMYYVPPGISSCLRTSGG
ncbi:MAG TPA: hypothetical protein PK477_01105 [Methanoregulaceae archaeon]|nr:hypothetical protein [Methanoregulaceae archaeon]